MICSVPKTVTLCTGPVAMSVLRVARGPWERWNRQIVVSSRSIRCVTRVIIAITVSIGPPRYWMVSTMWTPSGVMPPAGRCSDSCRHWGRLVRKTIGIEMLVSIAWTWPTTSSMMSWVGAIPRSVSAIGQRNILSVAVIQRHEEPVRAQRLTGGDIRDT